MDSLCKNFMTGFSGTHLTLIFFQMNEIKLTVINGQSYSDLYDAFPILHGIL